MAKSISLSRLRMMADVCRPTVLKRLLRILIDSIERNASADNFAIMDEELWAQEQAVSNPPATLHNVYILSEVWPVTSVHSVHSSLAGAKAARPGAVWEEDGGEWTTQQRTRVYRIESRVVNIVS